MIKISCGYSDQKISSLQPNRAVLGLTCRLHETESTNRMFGIKITCHSHICYRNISEKGENFTFFFHEWKIGSFPFPFFLCLYLESSFGHI